MSDCIIIRIKQLVGILDSSITILKGEEMNQIETLDDAWLRVESGKIHSFGEMSQFPQNLPANLLRIDANGGMVLPAYVDSHTHLVYAGTREDEFEMRLSGYSYEQIAEQGGGILNSAAKLAKATEDQLFEQAGNRLEEVIKLGTGTIEIKSGYGLDAENEIKMLRVVKRLRESSDATIKATFLGAHAIPLKFKGKADDYIDYMIHEALPKVADECLADYVDVFCEKGYFNVEQMVKLIRAAREHGLKPKVHVNQFYAFGAIGEAIKENAISVDHLEVMNDDDFIALKNSNTIATLLPLCSAFISIPYGPAKQLIENEIPIALATDYNPGSAPSGNMQLVQSLACINMKLTPTQALNASTINGAAALECQHETGSITVGKLANILITKPIPSFGFIPYNFGHNHIEKVLLKGKIQA